MRYLHAAYSFWILCCGFVLSRVNSSAERAYLVGSNYGDREDPNANAMVEYLAANGERVIVVGEWGADIAWLNLRRGSIRAAYHFFHSDGCFFTHSLSDIIPFAHQFYFASKVFKFPRSIFIQHGVIGLKKLLSSGVSMKQYIRSLEPSFDKMVVSSKHEQKIVESLGVPAQKIAITGLPRFDFYAVDTPATNTVLVFFTWQSTERLVAKSEQVSNSDAIGLLRQQGYDIVLGAHPMQRGLNSTVTPDEFQRAVRSCRLLITDDSSLAWDILYRGQDVVFYRAGDWLSDEPYLHSRRCDNEADLNRLILEAIYKPRAKQISNAFGFTEFNDKLNSERVFALVGSQKKSESRA